jgi:hypothetical protein
LPQRQLSAAPAAKTRHNRYRLGNELLDSRTRQIIAGDSKLRDGLQIHRAGSHYEQARVNRFRKQKNHPAGYRVTFFECKLYGHRPGRSGSKITLKNPDLAPGGYCVDGQKLRCDVVRNSRSIR